ncbi:MAG: hypothetical protein ABIK10_06325 [candidate division WOR-3 bacterium]
MKSNKYAGIFWILTLITLIITCGQPRETEPLYKIIAQVPNPGYPQSLIINANYAYVASGQAGLVVYDVSNCSVPVFRAQWLDTLYPVFGVTIRNNYAYLASGKTIFNILNISNLDSIKLVNEINFAWIAAYGYDVFTTDTNYLYIAAREKFLIADVSNPAYPEVLSPHALFPSNVRSVVVKDSFAYLALEQLGVYVMNVKTNPRVVVGGCDTPSNARHLFVLDTLCYVADGRGGLIIINIKNPRNILPVATLKLSGYAQKVFVKDTLAYLACGDAGLAIVNVKIPMAPQLVEFVPTSYAKGVWVDQQENIYVADRDLGLVIIKSNQR